MTKRYLNLFITIVFATALVACGGGSSSGSNDEVTAETDTLVLPSQLEVVTNES